MLSTVTGNVVLKVADKLPDVPRDITASSLAIIGGSIVLFLGLARLGWIVEFITLAAISAFMTGSAINIAAGQVPAMMGITGVKTREATYKVIINTLKHLPSSNLNAAIGLSALAMLYVIRFTCGYLAKRYPAKQRMFFFISTLRTAFVILLYVLISYLCNREHRKNGTPAIFATLGDVPRGMSSSTPHTAEMLTWNRIPTCACPRCHDRDHISIRRRPALHSNCASYRTHFHLKVFWKSEQLYNRPIAGVGGHWRYQCSRCASLQLFPHTLHLMTAT